MTNVEFRELGGFNSTTHTVAYKGLFKSIERDRNF